MLKSYFKVAWRNLQKNKLVSFINIFGLGLSMSIGLILMIRLQDAFSYDTFHTNKASIYRINSSYKKNNGGEQWKMASTPLPLLGELQTSFSSIEQAANLYPALDAKATASGKTMGLRGAFTESSFFKVFSFPFEAGNPATALDQPNSIVLSKPTAERFFGKQAALGKLFQMESGDTYIVTGVMKALPGKTHLNYDAFASYTSIAAMEQARKLPPRLADWFAFNAGYTYILVKKGLTAQSVNNELSSINAHLNKINKLGTSAFSVQSLQSITPGRESLYNDNSGSSWGKFYFEIGIAFIILLAACFNYTNLTTARALTRAKEVGIRKVTGAKRYQIFIQYIVESLVLSFLSLAFAWVLMGFIIQYAPFNDGYEFIPSSFRYNPSIIAWSLAFACFTGLLAGTAPAWMLSSFKPVRVLKNLTTAKIFGKISIQKTLIVFQYSLSLIIIIFLLAFYQQFQHLAEADTGYKRDGVFVIPLNGLDADLATKQLSAVPGVHSVSASSSVLTGNFTGLRTNARKGGDNDPLNVNYIFANPAFVHDMHLAFVAGENFSARTETQEQYVLLNEQAAFGLGFKDYAKAIGQPLWLNDSVKLVVSGIIKNFYYENAARPIQPLAIRNKAGAMGYLYIQSDKLEKGLQTARMLAALQKLAPKQPLNGSWLDEDLKKSYSQTATLSLLGYIAFMVVAIATLGLTGLVVYTVETKRKEISIRKILGAEARQIIRLLSTGFVKLLFIAGIIAVPIGFTAGYLFLQNFPNKAHFGVATAIGCFLLLLLVGLVTIIAQTARAATANPVKDMRME